MKKDLDRRAFTKSLLMGAAGISALNPLDLFINQMTSHFMLNAQAIDNGIDAFSEYKFINFTMPGGMPKWHFDLPLMPNGVGDPFIQNTQAINQIIGGVGSYGHTKVGNYYLPIVWDAMIPLSNGTFVKMKDALGPYFMTIRGVNLQIDSHDINLKKQLAPFTGNSLLGHLADKSNAPIPASGRGGGYDFYSAKGRGFTNMSTISDGVSSFLPETITYKSKNVESAIDNALLAMQTQSVNHHKFIPSTYVSRTNAKNIMKKNFTNLTTVYNSLVSKYTSLITRAITITDSANYLAGVDNLGLVGSKRPEFGIDGAPGSTFYYVGTDLSKTVIAAIGGLAESMAIAEYMVTEGYSTISSNSFNANLALNLVEANSILNYAGQRSNNNLVGLNNDPHYVGSFIEVISRASYFRAVAACLVELISRLQAKVLPDGRTLFDKSLIALTTDFNRSPRNDGSGGDHGWNGSNYTLFSGMIRSTTVVGNITSTTTGEYKGTWGRCDGVGALGGRDVLIGNVMSTICNILETDSISPNDMALAYKKDGVVVSAVEKPKNTIS